MRSGVLLAILALGLIIWEFIDSPQATLSWLAAWPLGIGIGLLVGRFNEPFSRAWESHKSFWWRASVGATVGLLIVLLIAGSAVISKPPGFIWGFGIGVWLTWPKRSESIGHSE